MRKLNAIEKMRNLLTARRAMILFLICSMLGLPSLLAQGQVKLKDEWKFHRSKRPIPNQYIVVLKDDFVDQDFDSAILDLSLAHGGTVKETYRHAIKAFAVEMSEAAARALSQDPRVEFVEEDGIVSASAGGTQLNPPSWGLDRVDQRNLPLSNSYTYNFRGGSVSVYVIDTGILTSHQEFGLSRANVAYDAVGDGRNGIDCNGHGTHVAGTIAGTNVGVAKRARVYSVRVLGCNGSGSTSDVIEGVDWVTANHLSPAVANMSLGGSASSALDAAVRRSIAAGVTYVIAAGNDGLDAGNTSPARVQEAITVGATDINDRRASFSNFGPVLDLFAPGVEITSAWIGSNTALNTISGTSMAAPHVSGLAALYLHHFQPATPSQVRDAIVNNATTGKVVNPGSGSANRLLYTLFF